MKEMNYNEMMNDKQELIDALVIINTALGNEVINNNAELRVQLLREKSYIIYAVAEIEEEIAAHDEMLEEQADDEYYGIMAAINMMHDLMDKGLV